MKNILSFLILFCCSSCLQEEEPAVLTPPDDLLHKEIFFFQQKREVDLWYANPVPGKIPQYFGQPSFFDISAPYPIVELERGGWDDVGKRMVKDSL